MEKLDKVIEAAERCSPKGCWYECPYYKDSDCEGSLWKDILEMLREYRDLKIAVTAAGVLERYRPAFEELAKGKE